ncbi:MAG: SRPBCC family protein, partial [Acidimicrobiales bacterium]
MIRDGLVVHRTRYPHPVPAVWEALTDPAALAAWLMPNDFAPVVGHRFRLDSRPGFDVIEAEVLDVEPRHLLRCRWTIDGVPTTVTFRLEADGDGTVLEL